MTIPELIAALRRGEAIPPEVLAALEPRKPGRPRQSAEKELAEAMALIERVETLSASLGSKQRAFHALASDRSKAASVERYYRRAKRLERVIDQSVAARRLLTDALKDWLGMIKNANE